MGREGLESLHFGEPKGDDAGGLGQFWGVSEVFEIRLSRLRLRESLTVAVLRRKKLAALHIKHYAQFFYLEAR